MINEYPINTFKGETRKELEEYILKREKLERGRINLIISVEIMIDHMEGRPTSRLTSLFNKIND